MLLDDPEGGADGGCLLERRVLLLSSLWFVFALRLAGRSTGTNTTMIPWTAHERKQ